MYLDVQGCSEVWAIVARTKSRHIPEEPLDRSPPRCRAPARPGSELAPIAEESADDLRCESSPELSGPTGPVSARAPTNTNQHYPLNNSLSSTGCAKRGDMDSVAGPSSAPNTRKRKIVRVACNPCRKRKLKCGAERPACRQCEGRNVECEYDTESADISRSTAVRLENEILRRQTAEQQRFLEILRNSSNEDSRELLERFKNETINDILDSIAAEASQGTTSNLSTAGSPASVSSRPNLEAVSISSQSLAPSSSAIGGVPPTPLVDPALTAAINPVQGRDILYSTSTDGTMPGVPTGMQGFGPPGWNEPGATGSWADVGSSFGPDGMPNVYDPRLDQVDFGRWTAVPITTDKAVKLLAHYLALNRPVCELFDPDSFVRDLAGYQYTESCTPLLVNTVLFEACLVYAAVDAEAAALVPLFRTATEMLWLGASLHDTTATAAAGLIQSNTYAMLGENLLSLQRAQLARDMNQRLSVGAGFVEYESSEAPEFGEE